MQRIDLSLRGALSGWAISLRLSRARGSSASRALFEKRHQVTSRSRLFPRICRVPYPQLCVAVIPRGYTLLLEKYPYTPIFKEWHNNTKQLPSLYTAWTRHVSDRNIPPLLVGPVFISLVGPMLILPVRRMYEWVFVLLLPFYSLIHGEYQ